VVASEFIEDVARGSRLWDIPNSSGAREATSSVQGDLAQRDAREMNRKTMTSSIFLEDSLMNG
jgi:hypothetical protein